MKKIIFALILILIVSCQITLAQWVLVSNNVGAQCFYTYDNKLFAGTTTQGVLVSTDNGLTWTASNNGLTYPNVLTFASIGTNLFAGVYSGLVFRSTNSGSSWTPVNSGLLNLSGQCLLV